MDERLRTVVAAQVAAHGADLAAFGAWVDHVHVLVRLGGATTIADLARAMKGASAHAMGFRWQGGYGAYSVAAFAPEAVIRYVSNQRQRHAAQIEDELPDRADGDE